MRAPDRRPPRPVRARRAVDAGVRIVMGSGLPPYAGLDGTTATVREMELRQEAGMGARDVLAAATGRAAWAGVR